MKVKLLGPVSTGYQHLQDSKTKIKTNSFVFVFVIAFVGILAFVFAFVAFGLQQVSLFLHKLGAIIRGGSFLLMLWLSEI